MVPADSLDMAVHMMELQEAILSLTEESVEHVARNICATPLVASADGIKQIVHNLFLSCHRRRTIVKKVVDLAIKLMSFEGMWGLSNELKECLAVTDVLHDRWYRLFMVFLIAQKVVTPDDFASWIHNMPIGANLFTVFCWYAPYIEKFAPDDFQTLSHVIQSRIEAKDPSVPEEVVYYVRRLESMKAMNWAVHNDYFRFGYPSSSIPGCIVQDDINGLMSLSQSDTKNQAEGYKTFDVDLRVETTVFEGSEMVRHSPSLLQFAAFYQAPKCFRYLLSLGADTNAKDDCGHNVAQFAVAGGLSVIVDACQEKKMDFTGAACIAVEYHQFVVLEKLLNDGIVKIDESTPDYPSVVHSAAQFDNMRVLLYAMEEGVDVNITDTRGESPLHYAARCESINALLFFVNAYDIDINLQDEKGRTPLHHAVKCRKMDAIRILLTNNGLDVNLCDSRGVSPVSLAAKKGFLDILVILVNNNAMLNTQTDMGMTPLHLAAMKNHCDVVETLLGHQDIDINSRDMVCFIFIVDGLLYMSLHIMVVLTLLRYFWWVKGWIYLLELTKFFFHL